MQLNTTLASIKEFSNFFDHQLFVHCGSNAEFYAVKSGTVKQIKFPAHLSKLLDDKKILTKTFIANGETTVMHIFRLGDGHTLFLNDPGTGNVLNGFIMSLITLSSNVCSYDSSRDKTDSDMNSVLLDKLVAEFDKEKKKFAVNDKRQKEEIIILEEQAKEAYNQLDEATKQLSEKDAEINRLKKQLIDLAESYKALERKQSDMQYNADVQVGAELKKKNEALRDNNRKLVEMVKKSTLSITELHSELEMYLKDTLSSVGLSDEIQQEILGSVEELFSTEKVLS